MHESGTLIDRAIRYLEIGPAESGVLATEVVGLCKTSDLVADRVVVALLGSDPRVSRLRDGRWALVAQAGGSPKIEDCTFAVVDVETTGGASRGRPDRVTEIAVVVVRGDSYELVLDTLVNPQRPIGRKASELTRITNADVRHQPVFGEIADKVTGELVGRVFVAHNVGFDWRLVSSELRRTTDRVLDGPRLCTAKLARRV
ncbi:MAG: PolC-type DNA polymerase III, partial [Gemmatimonadales bacterium]